MFMIGDHESLGGVTTASSSTCVGGKSDNNQSHVTNGITVYGLNESGGGVNKLRDRSCHPLFSSNLIQFMQTSRLFLVLPDDANPAFLHPFLHAHKRNLAVATVQYLKEGRSACLIMIGGLLSMFRV